MYVHLTNSVLATFEHIQQCVCVNELLDADVTELICAIL